MAKITSVQKPRQAYSLSSDNGSEERGACVKCCWHMNGPGLPFFPLPIFILFWPLALQGTGGTEANCARYPPGFPLFFSTMSVLDYLPLFHFSCWGNPAWLFPGCLPSACILLLLFLFKKSSILQGTKILQWNPEHLHILLIFRENDLSETVKELASKEKVTWLVIQLCKQCELSLSHVFHSLVMMS